MEKIPCIKCDKELWEHIRLHLLKWGYSIKSPEKNLYKYPILVINDCGHLGACNNYSRIVINCFNRELIYDVEEFLKRAAELKGFIYKKKGIMEINGIEIKPGMGIYITDRAAENLYIVIPTKTGLGVVSYGERYVWEHLDQFLEQENRKKNRIVAICDVPDSSIEGDILWEKPKEMVITMDEIAKKFGYPVESIKIKK